MSIISSIGNHKKFSAAVLASILALVGLLNGLTVADIGKERAKVEKDISL